MYMLVVVIYVLKLLIIYKYLSLSLTHSDSVPRPLINGKCVGPLYGRINTVGNDRVVHTLDDNLIPVPENVAREQAEQHWEVSC